MSVNNLRSMVRGKVFKPRDRDIPISVDVQPETQGKGNDPVESDSTAETGSK